jgi:hypothetical protein
LDRLPTSLERNFSKAAELLLDAEHDVTAQASFPRAHWRKIWSTNRLSASIKEIKRRTNVVGVFPSDDAVICLVGAVLAEVHDDWQVADRRSLSEGSPWPSCSPHPPRRSTRPTPANYQPHRLPEVAESQSELPPSQRDVIKCRLGWMERRDTR